MCASGAAACDLPADFRMAIPQDPPRSEFAGDAAWLHASYCKFTEWRSRDPGPNVRKLHTGVRRHAPVKVRPSSKMVPKRKPGPGQRAASPVSRCRGPEAPWASERPHPRPRKVHLHMDPPLWPPRRLSGAPACRPLAWPLPHPQIQPPRARASVWEGNCARPGAYELVELPQAAKLLSR